MSIPLDFIETDTWPDLRPRVQTERTARLQGMLFVATIDMLKYEQGFIAALDWVLEEAKPKPQPREDDDDY